MRLREKEDLRESLFAEILSAFKTPHKFADDVMDSDQFSIFAVQLDQISAKLNGAPNLSCNLDLTLD